MKYTYDGTYLVSGSDDTNLRLWKSKASEQLGVVSVFNATHCLLAAAVFGFVCCLLLCIILDQFRWLLFLASSQGIHSQELLTGEV